MTGNSIIDDPELVPIEKIRPYERNPRLHPAKQIEKLANSIEKFGWTVPIIVDKKGTIIAGHGRYLAAKSLGLDEVPVVVAESWDEEKAKAYRLLDNYLAEMAEWDWELLDQELDDLGDLDIEIEIETEEKKEAKPARSGALQEKFLVPPFSVLDARRGWWRDRKKAWLDLGIQSELGRGENALRFGEMVVDIAADRGGTTSIFDPVLCELAYGWFCPPDGTVLDPFAGGSVRGIVAARMGRKYVGVELRPEQVAANYEQMDIVADCEHKPDWRQGDSMQIDEICKDVEADFLFTCPPYGNLEIYSDDPADISNMSLDEFADHYREIIRKSCSLLKEDSFAAIVVGNYVDQKTGAIADIYGITVEAFAQAGLQLYNDAVYITPIGSLPVRVVKPFETRRRLGRAHQHFLVFLKGDAKKAVSKLGECQFMDPEDGQQE